MSYTVSMSKDKIKKPEDLKKLDKHETALREQFKDIMKKEEVNISLFLPVLCDKVPSKDSKEYYITLKKAGMKVRRGSLTVDEVLNMLKLVSWKIELTLKGKPVSLLEDKIDKNIRLRFTDFMHVAELLNIEINWKKQADGRSSSNEKLK